MWKALGVGMWGIGAGLAAQSGTPEGVTAAVWIAICGVIVALIFLFTR